MGHYLGMKFARNDKGIRTGIGKFQYDQLSYSIKKSELTLKQIKKVNLDINDIN